MKPLSPPCQLKNFDIKKDLPSLREQDYELKDGFYDCKYNAPPVDEISREYLNVYYMATSSRTAEGLNYTYLTELAKAHGITGDKFILLCQITTEAEIVQRSKST